MSSSSETLTVRQLIAKLKKCKPDALVNTEGCDCIGDAVDVDVSIYASENTVLITRSKVHSESK